jgi:hypothetical protein
MSVGMFVLLACDLLPASRESVESAVRLRLPPGATSFRLYNVNVGHDSQQITLVPAGEWDKVEIESWDCDNNLPKRARPRPRRSPAQATS